MDALRLSHDEILDVASQPQLAEILNSIEQGDEMILTRDGRKIAEVKPAEEEIQNPKKRVRGSHPNAISYIADDLDAELPESFWLGEE